MVPDVLEIDTGGERRLIPATGFKAGFDRSGEDKCGYFSPFYTSEGGIFPFRNVRIRPVLP